MAQRFGVSSSICAILLLSVLNTGCDDPIVVLSRMHFSSDGGSGIATVAGKSIGTVPQTSTNEDWITLGEPVNVKCGYEIVYVVHSNTGGRERIGAISIASRTVQIVQSANSAAASVEMNESNADHFMYLFFSFRLLWDMFKDALDSVAASYDWCANCSEPLYSKTRYWGGEAVSRKPVGYGLYDVRMNPPQLKGFVSAFFLFSDQTFQQAVSGSKWDWKEIDIEFAPGNKDFKFAYSGVCSSWADLISGECSIVSEPPATPVVAPQEDYPYENAVSFTTMDQTAQAFYFPDASDQLYDKFNDYSILWTPNRITFYINGQVASFMEKLDDSQPPEGAKCPGCRQFDDRLSGDENYFGNLAAGTATYMHMNMWDGTFCGGCEAVSGWGGNEIEWPSGIDVIPVEYESIRYYPIAEEQTKLTPEQIREQIDAKDGMVCDFVGGEFQYAGEDTTYEELWRSLTKPMNGALEAAGNVVYDEGEPLRIYAAKIEDNDENAAFRNILADTDVQGEPVIRSWSDLHTAYAEILFLDYLPADVRPDTGWGTTVFPYDANGAQVSTFQLNQRCHSSSSRARGCDTTPPYGGNQLFTSDRIVKIGKTLDRLYMKHASVRLPSSDGVSSDAAMTLSKIASFAPELGFSLADHTGARALKPSTKVYKISGEKYQEATAPYVLNVGERLVVQTVWIASGAATFPDVNAICQTILSGNGLTAPVSNLKAAKVSNTAAKVTWTAPATGSMDGYKIYWGTNLDSAYEHDNREVSTAGTAKDITIDIVPGQLYRIWVEAWAGNAPSALVNIDYAAPAGASPERIITFSMPPASAGTSIWSGLSWNILVGAATTPTVIKANATSGKAQTLSVKPGDNVSVSPPYDDRNPLSCMQTKYSWTDYYVYPSDIIVVTPGGAFPTWNTVPLGMTGIPPDSGGKVCP